METFRVATTDRRGFYQGVEDIQVHDRALCEGSPCCIHHPSKHHMVTWRQLWRDDRKMMERLCPQHGVGHPDPDDMSYDTAHGCCGCCRKSGGEG